MTCRYLLRTETIRDRLDRHHWTHHRAARHLGVSPAYFSQLVNRRRTLTPTMRAAFLASPLFAGVDEASLWDRVAVEVA